MKLIKNNKKGFSLLELMIAVTIGAILMMATYAPYSYYSNKAKVRITAKEISQVLYDARNLAIHGLDSGSGNLSVGVYFDASDELKDKIQLFSFSYDYDLPVPDNTKDGINLEKTILLKKGLQIDSIGGKQNGFFLFEAISGSGSYMYSDSGDFENDRKEFTDDKIKISFSFKGSDVLKKEVIYFTKTNITDY